MTSTSAASWLRCAPGECSELLCWVACTVCSAQKLCQRHHSELRQVQLRVCVAGSTSRGFVNCVAVTLSPCKLACILPGDEHIVPSLSCILELTTQLLPVSNVDSRPVMLLPCTFLHAQMRSKYCARSLMLSKRHGHLLQLQSQTIDTCIAQTKVTRRSQRCWTSQAFTMCKSMHACCSAATRKRLPERDFACLFVCFHSPLRPLQCHCNVTCCRCTRKRQRQSGWNQTTQQMQHSLLKSQHVLQVHDRESEPERLALKLPRGAAPVSIGHARDAGCCRERQEGSCRKQGTSSAPHLW